jgi:hypothetical protein
MARSWVRYPDELWREVPRAGRQIGYVASITSRRPGFTAPMCDLVKPSLGGDTAADQTLSLGWEVNFRPRRSRDCR